MRCPNCKLENPPSAQWCDCGYEFGSVRPSTSNGPAHFCSFCGSPLAGHPESRFCSSCGRPVLQMPASPAAEERVILEELRRRGLTDPSPTVHQTKVVDKRKPNALAVVFIFIISIVGLYFFASAVGDWYLKESLTGVQSKPIAPSASSSAVKSPSGQAFDVGAMKPSDSRGLVIDSCVREGNTVICRVHGVGYSSIRSYEITAIAHRWDAVNKQIVTLDGRQLH